MQPVTADTGPINDLILIEHIDVLPALFKRVILPSVVRDELKHPKAEAVRNWIAAPPARVQMRRTGHVRDASLEKFDAGEEDAIALAMELHAEMLLIDDREEP